MSVLLLRLGGPLQSWGSSSRFARRSTEKFPTKSGVLGLLAAAQGRRRTDSIEDLLGLRFGVRIDQEGELMQDFHTAHRPDGQSMPLTRRFYLTDAVFVAAVETADTGLLADLDAAVRAPHFPLFLGRRSCPPSLPIASGVHEGTLDDVLRQHPWQASDWYRRRQPRGQVRLRVVRDAEPADDAVPIRDVPISFDPQRREYGWREVTDSPPVVVENPAGRDVEHDAFGVL